MIIKIRRPMGVICIVFIIILLIVLEGRGGVDESATYIKTLDGEVYLDGREVTITGTVKDKIYKNNSHIVHLKDVTYVNKGNVVDGIETYDNTKSGDRGADSKSDVEHYGLHKLKHSNVIVYLKDQDEEDFFIGQRVEVKGKFNDFALAENDGQFNSRRYYRIRDYAGNVKKGEIVEVSASYNKYLEFLHRCKVKVKRKFYENMPESEAGTMSAIVLGDKSGLDEEVKEMYQSAGISHVLSLSGLHIASIGLGLFSFLVRIGISTPLSSVISTLIMISYSVMTGMATSTIRALIMFILGLIAKNLNRTYDILSAVYLSSILILFENPYLIYDSGFLLSVSAVIGIGMIYPVLDDMTELKTESKPINKIRQGICVSISATLATMPVVMNSFYKISRFGIFLNIIIVPLMSVLLGLGVVGGTVGALEGAIGLAKLGSLKTGSFNLSLYLAGKMLKFYSVLAGGVGSVRVNTWVCGKTELWQTMVYISVIIGLCVIYPIARKDYDGRSLHKISNNINTDAGNVDNVVNVYSDMNSDNIINQCGKSNVSKRKNRIFEKNFNFPMVMGFALALLVLSYRNKPDMSINVLSVGQGACNVIYGKDIPVIMIDGGSTDVKDVYKYRIEPFLLSKGIDEIDYLFITHTDEDHISGIKEMLNSDTTDIRVYKIFMSNMDELCKQSLGIENVYELARGDQIKKGDLSIECISPEKGDTSADINDKSLVLKVSFSPAYFGALFTGDIGEDVERRILVMDKESSDNSIHNIDFVTVAHHGSKYSSCKEFLEYTCPRIVTISSGAGNSYGHPHAETMERLDIYAPKCKVVRTDELGQICVTVREGRVYLETFVDSHRNSDSDSR